MADRYTLTDVEGLAAHLATVLARRPNQILAIPATAVADAALGWAADHGWSQGARKHRSGTTTVAVCPKTVRGKHAISRDPIFGTETFYDWPCVLKAGHDGDCQPDPEWETEKVPFTELTAQELYGRLILAAGELRSERRSRFEQVERQQRDRRSVDLLLDLAATEGSGRSAKHRPGCWLKHVACLAREVLYRPHDAEQRLAEHRAATAPERVLTGDDVAQHGPAGEC